MIVHLLRIERFLNYAVDYFEEANPGNNTYYFICGKDRPAIRPDIEGKVEIIEKDSAQYQNLLDNCGKYDIFIFHSLQKDFFPIIDRIPENKTLCWIIFGMELYGNFNALEKNIYLPDTKRFYRYSKTGIINYFKPYYRNLTGELDNERKYLKYFKRMTHLAAFVTNLYDILRDLGVTQLKYIKFGYYSIEDTVGNQLFDKYAEGEDVFLGNSATFSNNHLDALHSLKDIPLGNRRLVVPLSYGNQEVVKKVTSQGRKLFGDAFVPLLDYLSREEYNQWLLSCKFVIMNFLRSQGRGNVLSALWLGAKVFLQEEFSYFQEFRNMGIKVFSMKEFDNPGEDVFSPLTPDEMKSNRDILWTYFNRKEMVKHTRNLVKELYTQN